MTPLERLLAEELPTGTFGGPRPNAPQRGELPARTTDLEAAAHRAALEAAIRPRRRHLTVVPDREAA